jgi:glycyl-tRNA synthetase beta chain
MPFFFYLSHTLIRTAVALEKEKVLRRQLFNVLEEEAARGPDTFETLYRFTDRSRVNQADKPVDMNELSEEGRRRSVELSVDLLSFLHDRLKVFLRDRGIRHDVIDAVLAMPGNDDLTLLVARAEALADTLKTEDGVNLIQGFKRANNILTQAEAKDGVEYSYGPDVKFAENDIERALFAALDAAQAKIAPAMAAEDFRVAMAAMAGLRAPIDAFFESVVVNAGNEMVRRNRLNLLHRIRAICLSVADLTKIEG